MRSIKPLLPTIQGLLEDGMSVEEVSETLAVSKESIRRYFAGQQKRYRTGDHLANEVKLLHAEGLDTKTISKRLGMYKYRVERLVS
jgi:DNA-binding transcriptional regulator LsrR (DeoR family)